MAAPSHIVILFDCDNTLLDHDHVVADLRNHLEHEFGPRNRDRYFEIFEALRKRVGLRRLRNGRRQATNPGGNEPWSV